MPDLPIFLSFLVAASLVVIVPGVTVSGVVGAALGGGLAAGLATEAGVQVGRFLMIVVVALALQLVTQWVGAAFDVIKYIGAAYLVWLGVGYLRSRGGLSTEKRSTERSLSRQALNGFVILWSNPKALIFFGAFLPQFVNPAYPAVPQVIVLGMIEMALGLLADGAYILLAVTARSALGPGRMVIVNRVAGVLLIGAAFWLALQHH
jgi:threonine/homoserine/homoserine lactone efflux protein